MIQRFRRGGWVWLVLLALGVSCAAGPPIAVTAIQVGRSRNSDKTIGQPTFQFRSSDTILVAVVTDGEGSNAKIRARWTYGGGVVGDSEQTVSQRDHAVTPFELRSAGGFPLGEYTLEIFLNGTSAGTRQVHVK
jgi:hypothetical protein